MDEDRYAKLTTADRVAYRQAKLAYAQAYAQYVAAELAARATFYKPYDDFRAARAEYDNKCEEVETAVTNAKQELDKLGVLAGKARSASSGDETVKKLDPNDLKKPDSAKAHLDQLQAAVDAYKKAADGVAAAVAACSKAEAALLPLAEPGKPEMANKAKHDLATDQYSLDMAQAQVHLEAAFDAYMVKHAELRGNQPH